MLAIFEYKCLVDIVPGKDTRPTTMGYQNKYDERDREAVMLIKLSITNEMLLEVQTEKTSVAIWKRLQKLHETSNKGDPSS